MIFNEIMCHVNISFGLVGGMHRPLCLRLQISDRHIQAVMNNLKFSS